MDTLCVLIIALFVIPQRSEGICVLNRRICGLTLYQFVYTIKFVEVVFDAAKDAENISKHGISLQRAGDFDVDTAFFTPENSQDYREERWKAIGWLDAMFIR